MKDKESLQKIYFKKEHKNKWLGEEIKWLQRKKLTDNKQMDPWNKDTENVN